MTWSFYYLAMDKSTSPFQKPSLLGVPESVDDFKVSLKFSKNTCRQTGENAVVWIVDAFAGAVRYLLGFLLTFYFQLSSPRHGTSGGCQIS